MRAAVFIDGQNLFYGLKSAFGLAATYPTYDPMLLGRHACDLIAPIIGRKAELVDTRFYTGIPKDNAEEEVAYKFWQRKISQARKDGVTVVTRSLQYIPTPTGGFLRKEKGIDVRIAIDILMMGITAKYDVAILFSQDSDFAEVADEIRRIAHGNSRFAHLKTIACYPRSENPGKPHYGAKKWTWCGFDRIFYERCTDLRNYHGPKRVDKSLGDGGITRATIRP